MTKIRTLKNIEVKSKRVLVRVDLNVPMKNGRIEDITRVVKIVPTIKYLVEKKAKVIVISHFGRPNGGYVRDMSLVPLADALGDALGGINVKFAVDCIGKNTEDAVAAMQDGDVLLLENLRFHAGEEKNDPAFVDALAALAEIYVNDTFSCSHRSHASIVGLAGKMPSVAGLLLQDEIENLERVLGQPATPMAAVVGGSKVSTKLKLLYSLVGKVKLLAIGGAMANTFLAAGGYKIGKSLYEKDLVGEAKKIMAHAKEKGCEIFLPIDVIAATELKDRAKCKVVTVDNIPADHMILDLGPRTIATFAGRLKTCKTVIWNGPLGAFEYRPFDVASISLAQNIAAMTENGEIVSVAGGGDIVAALGVSGLTDSFSYISTAGGAFLDWLQGEDLPGVRVLVE